MDGFLEQGGVSRGLIPLRVFELRVAGLGLFMIDSVEEEQRFSVGGGAREGGTGGVLEGGGLEERFLELELLDAELLDLNSFEGVPFELEAGVLRLRVAHPVPLSLGSL